MGVFRIIVDFDIVRVGEIIREPRIRDWWRGWSEKDIDSLVGKLDEPFYYIGGTFKITKREHLAWYALNRRLLAETPTMIRSPILTWAEGRGLFPMVRLSYLPRS
jgi:hypothetical protein